MTFLKACGRWGHVFATCASPRPWTKKLAMSPSSTVHGGQYYAKYFKFEQLLHAALVADFGAFCLIRPLTVYRYVLFGINSKHPLITPPLLLPHGETLVYMPAMGTPSGLRHVRCMSM